MAILTAVLAHYNSYGYTQQASIVRRETDRQYQEMQSYYNQQMQQALTTNWYSRSYATIGPNVASAPSPGKVETKPKVGGGSLAWLDSRVDEIRAVGRLALA